MQLLRDKHPGASSPNDFREAEREDSVRLWRRERHLRRHRLGALPRIEPAYFGGDGSRIC